MSDINIKIAIAQINSTVGDLLGNMLKIIAATQKAVKGSASLVIFPELVISGYPPEDLILKKHFVEDCEKMMTSLAAQLPKDVAVIVGCPISGNKKARNAAVICSERQMAASYAKILLPNYGVFDEKRVFEAGSKPLCLQIGGARLGLNICEDTWFRDSPATENIKHLGLHALINLSASPYHGEKITLREEILSHAAKDLNAYLFYCNLIGGQDEVVFDGGSMVLNSKGEVVSRAKQFEEDLLFFDLPLSNESEVLIEDKPADIEWVFLENHQAFVAGGKPRIEERHGPLEEIYEALKLGTRDYVNKCGFEKVLIAISGGIDSALVAAIAVDALGADRVVGVTMPSQYSSEGTLSDAGKLAENLGIELHTIPIEGLFGDFNEALSELFAGKEPGLAEENIQARIRGNLIMAISNKFGYMVLTTGNKSEIAVGYCTLYGDMAGGYAVIKDVPKTKVFELCTWRNEKEGLEIIPESTITRPPSAELRPDQKDSDSLPPYEVLDDILERYVEHDESVSEIIAAGHAEKVVRRVIFLTDLNEYKRRQAAPGVKITPKAFGKDRRMPIINKYKDS